MKAELTIFRRPNTYKLNRKGEKIAIKKEGKMTFVIRLTDRGKKYRTIYPEEFTFNDWNIDSGNRRNNFKLSASFKEVESDEDGYSLWQKTKKNEYDNYLKKYNDGIAEARDRGLLEGDNRFEDVLKCADGHYKDLDKIQTLEDAKQDELKIVLNFWDQVIEKLKEDEDFGNARSLKGGRNKFESFLIDTDKGTDLTFDDLDSDFIYSYRVYLDKRNKPSTNSVYLRSLRNIYNRAISKKVISDHDYPFRDKRIMKGLGKTFYNRRGLRLSEVNKILEYWDTLDKKDPLWESAAIFAFGFKSIGTNFVDLARLKRTDIDFDEGEFSYIRFKTRKRISEKKVVDLLPETAEILKHFITLKDAKNSNPNQLIQDDYVFPMLTEAHTKESTIDNRVIKTRKIFNENMRIIAKEVNIKQNLSSYVYRHSTFTVAVRDLGMTPEEAAQFGQWSDEAMALRYTQSLEKSEIKKLANKFAR